MDGWIIFSDHNFSCEEVNNSLHNGELILDRDVLMAAHDSVQTILDCVPSATKILANIHEIPIREALTINKPLTILSEVDNVRAECASGGIKIRCVCAG